MTDKPSTSKGLEPLAARLVPAHATGAGNRRREPIDCGHFDITIARDGTWYYRGSPIGRLPLVRLFSTVLRRAEDGSYWLETPVERGRITVEDVPFVAVELIRKGEGREQELIFRTNIDDTVAADAAHPLRVVNHGENGPSPYILLRDGLEARLNRPVFYELVELGCEEQVGEETLYGVWSKGQFFPLGRLTEG
ncbi:MAG TPA: DUF1285 domain-containing protein [Stellaceae bacterium]|nr:DUF1285 domain-containing protein [Stellaceae bacterium]